MRVTTAGTQTIVKEYAPGVSNIEYSTTRIDGAGRFTFTLVEGENIAMGAKVVCKVDNEPFFTGYVFKVERTQGHKTTYTCYDQLRYLKAKASYMFEAAAVEDIIRRIANDFNLNVGALATTGYKFPMLIKENESCLDIIFDALTETTIQTGKIFVFYDKNGSLVLEEAKNLVWNAVIAEKSLLANFNYAESIDEDTYNRIKFVRPNKNTGRADAYVYEDSDTQKQWGVLQLYRTVDENMNAAQIENLCQTSLAYYNRAWQTLKLSKIAGNTAFRAGWSVFIHLGAITGDIKATLFMTEKVTHKLQGNSHFMDIEVKRF